MAKREQCPSCGGFNTSTAPCSMVGPRVSTTILLGLWYMIGHAAVTKEARLCHACGHAYQSRSPVFKALVWFVVLALLVAWSASGVD